MHRIGSPTAHSTSGAVPSDLLTQTVNPVITAGQETFSLMLETDVQRTGFSARDADASLYEITALIGVTGPVAGSLCLSLGRETAIRAVQSITGTRSTIHSELVRDGVGELSNIIVGSAKESLDIPLDMGLPSVIVGTNYEVTFPRESQPLRLEFESGLGPLLIDFGFSRSI